MIGEVRNELRQQHQVSIPHLDEEGQVALPTPMTVVDEVLHLGSVFEVATIVVGFTFVQHPPRVFVERSLEPEGMIRVVPKQNPRGQAQRASKEAGFVGIARKHFDVR